MRETKDHLCTLLITFSDWDTANKEMTTAHTFVSTDPANYPQQRRVVHSRQMMAETEKGRNGEKAAPLMSSAGALIERVSQSSLSVPSGASLGSDMVQIRQVIRSPPVSSVPLATSARPQQQQQSSAGRFINSPHGENASEESNDRLSGQLKHSPSTGTATPLAIGVHEVSLSYRRPNPNAFSLSPPEDRHSLPAYLGSPPAQSSAFFPSGSVQMHFSAGKSEEARLLYTVDRPAADWTFDAGESIQISDSRTKKRETFPTTMGRTIGAKSPGGITTTTMPRGNGGEMEATTQGEGGQKQKQQQQPKMTRGMGAENKRRNSTTTTMFGPSPAQSQRPFGTSLPQSRHGPVLSHHQTRSYESNEESKMSEERGRGKSRTVFEKSTCELLTERSVTTYGRWPNGKPSAAAEQPPKETKGQQPSSKIVQQRGGLPRTRHEEMNGTYLYTRYGDAEEENNRRRRPPMEVGGEQRGERVGEGGGRTDTQRMNGGPKEWEVTKEKLLTIEEEMNCMRTKGWRRTPQGKWTNDDVTTPLVVLLSERPFRGKNADQFATVAATKEEQQLQGTRIIDFDTYKKEVEQLQQQATAMGRGTGDGPMRQRQMLPMAMAPAVVIGTGYKKEIVLPKAKQPTLEATLKRFASDQLTTTGKSSRVEKEEKRKRMGEEEEEEGLERRREEEERMRREEMEERRMEERREKEEQIRREEMEERREEEERMRREEMEERGMEERRKEEERMRREEMEKRRMEERREKEEQIRREEMEERREEEERMRREEMEERRMEERREKEEQIRREEMEERRKKEEALMRRREEKEQELIRNEAKERQRIKEAEVLSMCSPRPVTSEGKGQEERAGEKMRDNEKKGQSLEKQQQEEAKAMMPTEYDLDMSRTMGRHLLETLSRELQYQEEFDTEVSKRRRRMRADGREETEEAEEWTGEEEERRMRKEGEEVIKEEERGTPIGGEEEEPELLGIGGTDVRSEKVPQQQQDERQQKKAIMAPLFVPIHRRDAKVSISGELSLPPVREEGEDEEEDATFEHTLAETAITQTLGRKRLPPPPPPKPPHSLFGTHLPTTFAAAHPSAEPFFRESSFSSYSNFPHTFSTPHTNNTMEAPSVASSDYRSAISSRPYFARPLALSPTRYMSDGGGTRVLKMVSESSSISSRPLSPYPASTTATAIRDAREREKKEMSELNDRLANYIEKVRFLEAQNRKLETDLDFLHKRWGKDASNVREMYETDLRQAKKLLEETQRQKDDLEKKAKAMEEEMDALKKKNADARSAHDEDKKLMDELLQSLSSLEAELGALKRRLEILDEDLKALRRENQYLSGETQKARTELDQETLNRIDYQNQVQTLLEEIDFLRRAHEAEIQDLQAMASRDTTGENREFFRNELASAIREIRNDYDVLNNRNRSDIESWYKMKVQEIQTLSARQSLEQNYAKEEVKRLRTQLGELRGKLADLEGRNSLLERQAEELAYQVEDDQRAYESALNDRDAQIRKLRDEAQALMLELQMLLDTKQTLDAEIAIYRKMLEGEEDRSGLYQLVEQVVKTQNIRRQDEAESQRVLRGEKSSRQSYQRSAKGNVSILDTSPEGKYVVLENTHRSKEEPIGEWKMKRRIDGKREIVYTFPKEFVLRPGKSVKVWARGQGISAPPDQLLFDGEDSFGTGNNVQTLLYNRDGEERASLIQRSSGR